MALGQGVEVDMVTGEPIEPSTHRLIRERAQQQKLLSQQDRMNTLALALSSPHGDALMKIVTDQLAARIKTLTEQDNACQAYLGVLRTLGYELDIGRQAAEALVVASVGQAP